MTRTIIITADDYGLSRGVTDSILETVDLGPVKRVSILANGCALPYALAEYDKRKGHLELVVHLNLTEGKALSVPADVPHLVDADGRFRHSVGSLWFSHLSASRRVRDAYRAEIRLEAERQIALICEAIGAEAIPVNGHQHVHLLPFVADELAQLPAVSSLRSVCEPCYVVGLPSLFHGIVRPVMRLLSRRASIASHAGNERFVGFLYAGRMTLERALKGLGRIPSGRVEVLFHPGSALPGELDSWTGDTAWHYAPQRLVERRALTSQASAALLDESYQPNNAYTTVFRFIVSGSLSVIVALSLLYAFTEWAKLWYVLSASIAFACSTAVSFVLQKFWTFDDRHTARVSSQVTAFIVLNLINLALNAVGIYVVVEWLHIGYITAEILVAGTIAFWSFFIMRSVIFKPSAVS